MKRLLFFILVLLMVVTFFVVGTVQEPLEALMTTEGVVVPAFFTEAAIGNQPNTFAESGTVDGLLYTNDLIGSIAVNTTRNFMFRDDTTARKVVKQVVTRKNSCMLTPWSLQSAGVEGNGGVLLAPG